MEREQNSEASKGADGVITTHHHALCGSYVLVEGKQVVGIVARFEVLEPPVVDAIGAPDAALSFTLHDVHVGAVFVHRQFRSKRLNPFSGGLLAVGRLPIGGNVEGNAIPAQWKWRSSYRYPRHRPVKMNKEAIDGKRHARKCFCENLNPTVIKLCEKAAAMFFITGRKIGGYHLLKLEIRPWLNRVAHDGRVMAKGRQRFFSSAQLTDVAGLDFDLRLVTGLLGH